MKYLTIVLPRGGKDHIQLIMWGSSVDFPILLDCEGMIAELVARGVLCHRVRAAPWEEALGSIHDLITPSWNWSL